MTRLTSWIGLWTFTTVLIGVAPGCGGNQTEIVMPDGDPEIESLAAPENTPLPPHLLVCGYHKNLSEPLTVHTYNEPAPAISLYDFSHSGAQMVAWMVKHPGGRAYQYRKRADGDQRAGIGRALSEPCFGDGDDADKVIRQIVIHRAAGADAVEAMGSLLRQGRTTHFLIDQDGVVHQALDPVHAAFAPTESSNSAVYIALVMARRPPEWVSPLLADAGALGASGTAPAVALANPLLHSAVPAPSDVFATREWCTVGDQKLESETPTAEQLAALKVLLKALHQEYRLIRLEFPLDKNGTPLRGPLEDAEFQQGLLADYHTGATVEPACLPLEALVP